jgi:hypothetical protein
MGFAAAKNSDYPSYGGEAMVLQCRKCGRQFGLVAPFNDWSVNVGWYCPTCQPKSSEPIEPDRNTAAACGETTQIVKMGVPPNFNNYDIGDADL